MIHSQKVSPIPISKHKKYKKLPDLNFKLKKRNLKCKFLRWTKSIETGIVKHNPIQMSFTKQYLE